MFSDTALLSPEFDCSAYLLHVLNLPNSEQEQARLARCSDAVQSQLTVLVAEQHEPLLQKVDAITGAQTGIERIQSSVSVLNSSTTRLRHTIADPAAVVQAKVTQLENAMATLELTRNVQRFIILAQRLGDVSTVDPPRAAKTLREIEELMESADLSGVDVVDRKLQSISATSAKVRTKAHELLKSGLQHQRHSEIGAALQCFYSFDTLAKVVTATVTDLKRDILKTIVQRLEVRHISSLIDTDAAAGRASEGARTREVVLGCLEKILGDVLHNTASITVLWRVLQRKRDPISQEPIITAMPDGVRVLEEYWLSVSTQLSDNIVKLTRRTNLHVMFIAEFPRFHRLIKSFTTSLGDFLQLASTGDPKRELGNEWLRGVTKEVREHFSSASLERLMEKVNALSSKFQSITPPPGAENVLTGVERPPRSATVPAAASALDVRPLMKLVHHEVAANQQDTEVVAIVLHNVCVAMETLARRLKEHKERHPIKGVSSVTSGCTRLQLLHVNMANCATTAATECTVLLGLLQSTPELDESLRGLRAAVDSLHSLVRNTIQEVFAAAKAALLKNLVAVQLLGAGELLLEKLSSFMSKFVLLFESGSVALEESMRDLGAAVLQRSLYLCALVRPLDDDSSLPLVETFLRQVRDALEVLQHNGKVAVSPKQIKTLSVLLRRPLTVDAFNAVSLDPTLLLLQLLQRLPQAVMPAATALVSSSTEELLVALDGPGPHDRLWDGVAKSMVDLESSRGVVTETVKEATLAVYAALRSRRR